VSAGLKETRKKKKQKRKKRSSNWHRNLCQVPRYLLDGRKVPRGQSSGGAGREAKKGAEGGLCFRAPIRLGGKQGRQSPMGRYKKKGERKIQRTLGRGEKSIQKVVKDAFIRDNPVEGEGTDLCFL